MFARASTLRKSNLFFRVLSSAPQHQSKTDVATILDRTANMFFMTEIFRALWLTLEIALKPNVTINYPFEKGALR